MKIRIRPGHVLAGPEYSASEGQVLDRPDAEAAVLVAAGVAEPLDPPTPPVTETDPDPADGEADPDAEAPAARRRKRR